MPGIGLEGAREDFRWQLPYVADRRAYARLLELADPLFDGWLGEALSRAWAGRSFRAGYERPLLLLAALRYAALRRGPAHPLYAALVTRPAKLDAITEASLRAALAEPEVTTALRERAIQTNETTRAVGWLWVAHLCTTSSAHEPLALVDLGTSAGLNLVADALPMPWTDQDGAPIAVAPRPPIALRLGIDRAPLDVGDPESADWLRACTWQDDVDRLERLERALSAFRTASASADGPRLVTSELSAIADVLPSLPRTPRVLLLQSIVRDYLPPDERATYEAALHAFLQTRHPRSALWIQLELSDRDQPFDRSVALSVTFRDDRDVRELVLARTHPHPRVLHVDRAAVQSLVDALDR